MVEPSVTSVTNLACRIHIYKSHRRTHVDGSPTQRDESEWHSCPFEGSWTWYTPCPHGGFWPLRGYSRLRPLRCESSPWQILDTGREEGREVEWVGEKGWVGRRPCCRGGVAERAVTMTTRQFCTPKGRGGAVRPPTGSRGDRKPGLERKKKREGTWWRVGEAVWGEKNEEERCDTHVDIPTVVRTLP